VKEKKHGFDLASLAWTLLGARLTGNGPNILCQRVVER